MPLEPVTAVPVRQPRWPVSFQTWRDVVFLHWPCHPDTVRPLLPKGTEPDVLHGSTWLGVVALHMSGVRAPGLPSPPHVGDFLELNVRVYTHDVAGRRGVVFLAMEASRLAFVLSARAAARLPYNWSDVRLHRDGDEVAYRTRRRWPNAGGAGVALRVRVGAPAVPTELDHFVTARWGLHSRWAGATVYTQVAHERWPLHACELLDWDDSGLLAAAGLPMSGRPTSALYAPSVHARLGLPRRTGGA